MKANFETSEREEAWGRASFRTRLIQGTLGLRAEKPCTTGETSIDLPGHAILAGDWTIGAIVGASGSGKTRLATRTFGDAIWGDAWERDASMAMIDAVTDGVAGDWRAEFLMEVLTQVGLGSAPAWLRPVTSLSEGERFRFGLARQILRSIARGVAEPSGKPVMLVVDEFTCSLDRLTARNICMSVERWIRSAGREWRLRMVVVTCHDDVCAWLKGDWRCDMPEGALQRGPFCRPSVTLRVRRCSAGFWNYFAEHHYLSAGMGRCMKCYVVTEGKRLVAFCATGPTWGWPGMERIVRLVTKPAYQGLGIAKRLLRIVATDRMQTGREVRITTGHPALARSLAQDPAWEWCGQKKLGSARHGCAEREVKTSLGRPVVTFRFVGKEASSKEVFVKGREVDHGRAKEGEAEGRAADEAGRANSGRAKVFASADV